MNDKQKEEQIIQALEALEQGQTVDKIVNLFPGSEVDLRPALETAVMLDGFRVAHTNKAQTLSRDRFLAQAETLKEEPRGKRTVVDFWRRIVYPLAFLTTVLLVLGLGTILASQSALPGDVLYGPKLMVEGVRLSLVRDLQEQALLQEQFDVERVREIQVLIRNGRQADVVLSGLIESIDDEIWMVEGIPVLVGEDTIVDGIPDIGVEVQIKGLTNVNVLEAKEITVAIVEQPAPAPTATPEIPERPENGDPEPTRESGVLPPGYQPETVEMTPTVTPSPSSTSTATPTSTPTATATPTALPTVANTATPNPTPIPQPTSDDDNGNGNTNTNENTNNNTTDNTNENTNDNTNNNNNNSSGPGNGNENENENNNNNNNSSGPGNGNENENENENNNNNNNNSSGPGNGNDSAPGNLGRITNASGMIPAILLGLVGVMVFHGDSGKIEE